MKDEEDGNSWIGLRKSQEGKVMGLDTECKNAEKDGGIMSEL